MCIRDRFWLAEDRDLLLAEVRRVLVPEGRLLIAERIRAQACLLYTSDAADERSSVDLGGRRIIKKKKGEITLVVDSI